MPASRESPAPTVLATVTRGGWAWRARPGPNQFTPWAPWEMTICSIPSACSCSASSRWASMPARERPQISASSSVFGLISQGAASRPARRASPLLSSATLRLRRLRRCSSSPRKRGSTPGGRLPATTTRSWPGATVSIRARSSAWAAASTSGPGPLISVMRPSASASLMLLRVSPGTRTKASTKPRRAKSASKASGLSAPRKPETVRL
ncbi:hypothetical protein D3C84_680210 [compost metagenome]